MNPKRDWLDMTWEEISGADAGAWIAVLPVAAIEQHGPHLPLAVDSYIAQAYLDRVRALLPADMPVTFLPLQMIGVSQEHVQFPGTLSLSLETMVRMLTEIGEGVHRAGVRKLVVINSHGGNVAAIDTVVLRLRSRFRMLAVKAAWHRFGYPDGLFERDEVRFGIHGGDVETSLILAARPDTVREDKRGTFTSAARQMHNEFRWLSADRPAGFGWMTQDLHPSGAIGDPSRATRDKGEAALDHGARAFIELLEEVRGFDLARLGSGPLG